MALTVRDIGFRLGFDLDGDSIANVEKSINDIKNMVSMAIESIGVDFGGQFNALSEELNSVNDSVRSSIESIEDLEEAERSVLTVVKECKTAYESITNTTVKLLRKIGIGFSLTQINSLAEEFRGVNRAIASFSGSLDNVRESEQEVLRGANDCRTSYEAMARTVSNLVKSDSELFPIQDAVDFTSAVTKLLKTSGRSESEISGIMDSLNKSFQKGITDAETVNQLIETSPEAANLLSDALGVSKIQLSEMATQGMISCRQLKEAFLNSAVEIDAAFDGMDISITEALQSVRNSWGFMLADFDEVFGITNSVSRVILKLSETALFVVDKVRTRLMWLSERLGGTQKLLKLIAIAAGSILIAFNFESIIAFIKKLTSIMSLGTVKLTAIVGIILMLALLIEDFFSFMKGEDSLIGELLENAGIDIDKFRSNVSKIWENIKIILSSVFQGVKNVGGNILSVIKGVLGSIGGLIKKLLPGFAELIDSIASGNIDTEKWERFGELLASVVLIVIEGIAAVKTVKTVMTAASTAVKAVSSAISFLSSPIGIVILIIGALIAVIAILIKNWDKIKNISDAIEAWRQGILRAIGEFFKNIFSAIVAWFKNVFETIGEWISSVVNSVKEFGASILNGFKAFATRFKDTLVEGFSTAIEWITSLPEKALGWGADIVDGIANGIKNAVNKVGDAVKGVANKIKDFLGFSEPDEGPLSNFHTYMPDMIDLMSKGIKSGKGKISDALKELTGDMTVLARADVVSKPTAKAFAGSSYSSRSVVQNVNFTNTFNGDRAGQQKSAEAMRSASNDAVGEMARALAFAK